MNELDAKKARWIDILNSQQYQQELKYLESITSDFTSTVFQIHLYSGRAAYIYDNFLIIKAKNDLMESAIAIQQMLNTGIHNCVKRELRYLIEMTTKYLVVDYDLMGKPLLEKTEYLHNNIPNSSINIVDKLQMPFGTVKQNEFNAEVKDFFYKSCAYVHPSKKQIEELIERYENGTSMGFESAKMLSDINKLVFRAYDMILAMMFHGFGYSMSGDLFIQIFDENGKWKFHKGKYVKEISKQFNQKSERKRKA